MSQKDPTLKVNGLLQMWLTYWDLKLANTVCISTPPSKNKSFERICSASYEQLYDNL